MRIALNISANEDSKESVTKIEIGWENRISCAQYLVKTDSIRINSNHLYAERIDGLQVTINILAKNLTEFWATQ